MKDDPDDLVDGLSYGQPGDAAVPSEGSLGLRRVYTTPDGAMYSAGKLHLKVLDEHNTEQHIYIAILIAPALLSEFNYWATGQRNTVLLEADMTINLEHD